MSSPDEDDDGDDLTALLDGPLSTASSTATASHIKHSDALVPVSHHQQPATVVRSHPPSSSPVATLSRRLHQQQHPTLSIAVSDDRERMIQQNMALQMRIQELERKNEDLVNNMLTSHPNYTQIKNRLDDKFERYAQETAEKLRLEKLQYEERVNKLARDNADLQQLNEELTSTVSRLETENQELQSQIQKLNTIVNNHDLLHRKMIDRDKKKSKKIQKLTDEIGDLKQDMLEIRIGDHICDVFGFFRDKIVVKSLNSVGVGRNDFISMTDLIDYLPDLKTDSSDDDEDDIPCTTQTKIDQGRQQKAVKVIEHLGVEVTFAKTLQQLTRGRNQSTHFLDKNSKDAEYLNKKLDKFTTEINSISDGNQYAEYKDKLLQFVVSVRQNLKVVTKK